MTLAAVSLTTAGNQNPELCLDQIVLAAADVDAEWFGKMAVPHLKRVARHITVYCSTADTALSFSKQWSIGTHPLGLGVSPLIAGIEGITVVETSSLKRNALSFGHCYHRTQPLVIRDIKTVLGGAAPTERGLFFARPDTDSAGWWTFRSPAREKPAVASN